MGQTVKDMGRLCSVECTLYTHTRRERESCDNYVGKMSEEGGRERERGERVRER